MAAYKFVEKPLLRQLAQMGWDVKLQGAGIPTAPHRSLRESFSEIVIKQEFIAAIKALNLHQGKPWLTSSQLSALYNQFCQFDQPTVLANNKTFIGRLTQTQVAENTLTGERNVNVKIIDFDDWTANRFVAINQFRVDSLAAKQSIIADVVLFVNGLPLVVIVCRDFNQNILNPMQDAIHALQQFAGLRNTSKNLTPITPINSVPELFYTNQLMVACHGNDCKFGPITAFEQNYTQWRSIYPDVNAYVEAADDAVIIEHREQEQLVQGLLKPSVLLNITRSFTLFKPSKVAPTKRICRYQEYRAVQKTLLRFKSKNTGIERSGIVAHLQGSGKSQLITFLISCIRRDEQLKDYKIVLFNDKAILQTVAKLVNESVYWLHSYVQFHQAFFDDASTLNLIDSSSIAIVGLLAAALPVASSNEKLLIITGELTREPNKRQEQQMLLNHMLQVFPAATLLSLASAGAPENNYYHPQWFASHNEVQSPVIDTYEPQNAIDDGLIIKVQHEEKTSLIPAPSNKQPHLVNASERINAIAADLVEHYCARILPNGFKAMVVCSSRRAAVNYQHAIRRGLATKISEEQAKPLEWQNTKLLKQLQFIDAQVIISSSHNDPVEIVAATAEAKNKQAVSNFVKDFNYEQSETGIAFLIVVTQLLTGFDAPIVQALYVDKDLKDQYITQAINRINRPYPGKSLGYLVDYYGLAANIKAQLGDHQDSLTLFGSKEELLAAVDRHQLQVTQLFVDWGINDIEVLLQQNFVTTTALAPRLEDIVFLLVNDQHRAQFNQHLQAMLKSVDMLLPSSLATSFKAPLCQLVHLLAITRERYQDHSLALNTGGSNVREVTNEYLLSVGIDPNIKPIELLSPQFDRLNASRLDARAKATELKRAIGLYCQKHHASDPIWFQSKVNKLDELKGLSGEWGLLLTQLRKLKKTLAQRRVSSISVRDRYIELIVAIAFDGACPAQLNNTMITIADDVLTALNDVNWHNITAVSQLEGRLNRIFILSKSKSLQSKKAELTAAVIELAKNLERSVSNSTGLV